MNRLNSQLDRLPLYKTAFGWIGILTISALTPEQNVRLNSQLDRLPLYKTAFGWIGTLTISALTPEQNEQTEFST